MEYPENSSVLASSENMFGMGQKRGGHEGMGALPQAGKGINALLRPTLPLAILAPMRVLPFG